MQPQVRPLPLPLLIELQQIRRAYHAVLQDARRGRFENQQELAQLTQILGRLLAREARRPLQERGLPMRELALAVDRHFPELRDWTLKSALRERLNRRGLPA